MIKKPSFFIVGAPKCGTSSLAYYLRQHSQLFVPRRKDVPFFGKDLIHSFEGTPPTAEAYEAQFDVGSINVAAGDACVQYLYSQTAAQEIASYADGAQIIIMLRDPVELVYSLHEHNLWMREEDLTDFADALAAEGRRRVGQSIPPTNHFPQGLLYRDIGRLHEQVARYLDTFGDERVHLIFYDDFRRDSEGATRSTFDFLGVNRDVPLDLRVVNARKQPRSSAVLGFTQTPHPRLEAAFRRAAPSRLHGKVMPLLGRVNAKPSARPPLDPSLADSLRNEFADDVRLLSRRVHRDLSGWLPPG